MHGEVVAGTAHTFQGREAPVVIFDTVVDEPHWKVNLCIPRLDRFNTRLLNVALSRARRQLIFLGDLDYIRKTSRHAALAQLVDRLIAHGTAMVSAAEAVAPGLAARSADTASVVFGRVSAADAETVVTTHDEYFRHLTADLAAAARVCVVYSPFITANGLARVEPQLRAAVERGVAVYVITKAHDDRGKRELPEIRRLEDALTRWGVVVVHKRRTHEKVVLIDAEIVWSGSLNTLSFSDTQEVMLRFASRELRDDLARALRVDDLLAVYTASDPDGRAACPCCESRLETAEGDRGPYLTCPNTDCSYSRDLTAPAPRNGMLVCRACGEAVEFHRTEKRGAVWRCKNNNKHWQRVARAHLRLPRMRQLLTPGELRALCSEFGLSYDDVRNGTVRKRQPPAKDAGRTATTPDNLLVGD